MLLTITTTHSPATDLGYLLHKNPTKVQAFDLSFGQAHVVYPEVSDERCTVGLLLVIRLGLCGGGDRRVKVTRWPSMSMTGLMSRRLS